MPDSLTIDRDLPLSPAENYSFLRRQGIGKLQRLCGESWTDYNLHDPGITLLEALCYALTDLGYRTSFNIEDLLTNAAGEGKDWSRLFFTADRILPCNPVTLTDYRKMAADIAGVRNAWVEVTGDYEVPLYLARKEDHYRLSYEAEDGAAVLPLKGLYRVLVEFEEDVLLEGREAEVLDAVKARLHRHRNLCEDFVVVSAVEYELFSIEADIRVKEGCDIEMIAARIYQLIRELFSPAVNFLTLEQMRQKGLATEEIFEGPLLRHGFIDTGQLQTEAYCNEVQLSDVIHRITELEGVIAIERLSIPRDAGSPFPELTDWLAGISSSQRTPRLDTANSVIRFHRIGDRHRGMTEREPDAVRVRALLSFLLAGSRKVRLKDNEPDWQLPVGEPMETEDYQPFQLSLPACYGMEEKILPEGGDLADRIQHLPEDKRQVLQLRGYLMLFEQVMANFLSQLAHVRDLFSPEDVPSPTYYTQIPKGINDLEALFMDQNVYRSQAQGLMESTSVRLQRNMKIMDHLLSRLGEELDIPSPLAFAAERGTEMLIRWKHAFLREADRLSYDRGKGFNYGASGEAWDTDNVAGFKKRVCRLLGMPDYRRTTIAPDAIRIEEVRHANDIKRYIVRLTDPADPEQLLLESIEYESRNEAELILNYFLEYGMDDHLYVTETSHDSTTYSLKKTTEERDSEIIAYGHSHHQHGHGPHHHRAMEVLKAFSERENFHVIEHLLLRPRINTRDASKEEKHSPVSKETVALLPTVAFTTGSHEENPVLPEAAPYQFRIMRTKGVEKNEGWRLSLANARGEEILFAPDHFLIYSHLTRRLAHWRQLAADRANFRIEPIPDGYYRLVLLSEGQHVAEGKKKYNEQEKATAEIDALVRFFSFDRHDPEMDSPGQAEKLAGMDPYSFHISILLPSWPARFRDAGFRHLLEKSLFLEIPAHICPHVYWLSHQEMQQFEAVYKLWIEEQCRAAIPNTEKLNHLIHVLTRLTKNNTHPDEQAHH